MSDSILVWDLGATNQTVVAFDPRGKIISSESTPTESEETPDGIIWPFEKMYERFCRLTRQLIEKNPQCNFRGLGVSTFGVCWGPVDKDGELTAPVISWKCERSVAHMQSRDAADAVSWLYGRTGAPPVYYNTLYTLMWMQKHKPDALEKAETFLMMPQLFVHKLTGVHSVDRAMATTSMLIDLKNESWDEEVFSRFGLPNKFPEKISQCGEQVGKVTAGAAKASGLPEGLPVVAGGHDTVVATASVGAGLKNRAFLSTGTWNLLVAQSDQFTPVKNGYEHTLAWQLNPMNQGPLGGYNHQCLTVGGLALDWMRTHFTEGLDFSELEKRLGDLKPGAAGLRFCPNLVLGTGPYPAAPGSLMFIKDGLKPEHYFQAALEGLGFTIHRAQKLMNLDLQEILIGGGLSKSQPFCRILSAMNEVPVRISDVSETTALGMAVLISVGSGLYSSVDEAWDNMRPGYEVVEATNEEREQYASVKKQYGELMERLSGMGS